MKHNVFITMIENYYGKYEPENKKAIILKYIVSSYKENELDDLFKKIVSQIDSKYKTPPDIKQIQELKSDNIEIRADNLFEEISKKANQYRDLVIEDPAGGMAFRSACGSLLQFTSRTKKDEQWIKKRFIQMYKVYSRNPQECENGYISAIGRAGEPVIIGDRERGISLLEANKQKNNKLLEELIPGLKRIE
jgi:hypothetical protein